ncbi:hypothetical protein, partial [Cyclobacterium roseum]|uniref:hypothetical protein n=1 Tax=Cyclobacterium roseum TaxID=2666137 RepID=UPI001F47A3C3
WFHPSLELMAGQRLMGVVNAKSFRTFGLDPKVPKDQGTKILPPAYLPRGSVLCQPSRFVFLLTCYQNYWVLRKPVPAKKYGSIHQPTTGHLTLNIQG